MTDRNNGIRAWGFDRAEAGPGALERWDGEADEPIRCEVRHVKTYQFAGGMDPYGRSESGSSQSEEEQRKGLTDAGYALLEFIVSLDELVIADESLTGRLGRIQRTCEEAGVSIGDPVRALWTGVGSSFGRCVSEGILAIKTGHADLFIAETCLITSRNPRGLCLFDPDTMRLEAAEGLRCESVL